MNEEQKPDELPEQEALLQPVECAEPEPEAEQPDAPEGPEATPESESEPSTVASEEEDREDPMSTDQLNETIEALCLSKAKEFHILGYDQVTGLDIWNCVSSKYKELPPMHKLVNDILSLRSTKFMNWLMIKAQTE